MLTHLLGFLEHTYTILSVCESHSIWPLQCNLLSCVNSTSALSLSTLTQALSYAWETWEASIYFMMILPISPWLAFSSFAWFNIKCVFYWHSLVQYKPKWFYHANYLHHFIDNASPLRDIHSLILEASNACCAHMQTMLQQSNCVHTILRQCKSYKMHNQMHAYWPWC